MVDSMKQIFLLKPEVLTPNRNVFMAKKHKWHLKAGSTVYTKKKAKNRAKEKKEKKLIFLERDVIASYLSDSTRFQHRMKLQP